MDNGQRPQVNAEMLQQALKAFGGANGAASTEDLAALAQRVGLQMPGTMPKTSNVNATQFVIMGMGGVEIALPAGKVTGVERLSDITPVPNTVNWVLGVANLRGAITSVVDLRQFCGLPRVEATSRSRVVVTSAGAMVIGFLVDSVNEIRVLPEESLVRDTVRQASPPWLLPYVEALVQIAGRSILVLDAERLLYADALHQYRSDL